MLPLGPPDDLSDLPDILALADTPPVALDTWGAGSDIDGCGCDHDPISPDDVLDGTVKIAHGSAVPLAGMFGAPRGFTINGFAVGTASRLGIRTYRVPGTAVLLPLLPATAPLLLGFAAEFHAKVEPLRGGWCWGFAFRAVRGSSLASFHAGGVAIDLNAPRHPLGKRGTFTPRQAATIRALCRKYGLRWGGDYRVRADEMHVEVIVSASRARQLVRELQAKPKVTAKPTVNVPRKPVPLPSVQKLPILRLGAVGHSVRNVQDALRRCGNPHLKLDGHFGPETDRLVRLFQKHRRIKPDGIVGPSTWTALRRVPR